MRLKKLGAAMAVVVALSAVLASSALATASPNEVNWQKGSGFGNVWLLTKPLPVTTSEHGVGTFSFHDSGTEVAFHSTNIECEGCEISNSPTGGSGTGKLKFTGVTVASPSNCTTSSTVVSGPLKFSARYQEGEADLVKFESTAGSEGVFLQFETSGASCPINNTWVVKGSLFGRFQNKEGVQATEQTVNFSPSINAAAGGSLHWWTEPASLATEVAFRAGGTPFGFAPGGVILPEATQTAAKWYTGATEGGVTELAGSQAVTAEQIGSSMLTATIGGQDIGIEANGVECVECKISNSPTGGSGTGKLKFTGVTVAYPANCGISSTFKTNALTLAANWTQGEAALVRFVPTSGIESGYTTLELTGAACPVESTIIPRGTLFGKFKNPQGVQATSQTVEFNSTINSNAGGTFHVSTEPATLTAIDVFKAGGLFFEVK